MHEISVAQDIIDTAETAALAQNSHRINAIGIRLGEFTTVVREALEFAFEIARQGTMAEHAKLQIELAPIKVECASCGPIGDPVPDICLFCPQCGLPAKIVSGEELQVEYVDLESETENVPCSASR